MRLFNPGAITTEWSNQIDHKGGFGGDVRKNQAQEGMKLFMFVCLM